MKPEMHRECGRKKSYASQSQANKQLVKMRDYNQMHTYECPHCFMWHIGHVPRDNRSTGKEG